MVQSERTLCSWPKTELIIVYWDYKQNAGMIMSHVQCQAAVRLVKLLSLSMSSSDRANSLVVGLNVRYIRNISS